MAWANGMVFIIGTPASAISYQPLTDIGAVHTTGLSGFGNQNAEEIEDTVANAIEEAACINNREEEEEVEEEGALYLTPERYKFASSIHPSRYDFSLSLCI